MVSPDQPADMNNRRHDLSFSVVASAVYSAAGPFGEQAETRFSRADVEASTMEHTRSTADHQPFQGDSYSAQHEGEENSSANRIHFSRDISGRRLCSFHSSTPIRGRVTRPSDIFWVYKPALPSIEYLHLEPAC
jgi:hypothetical protein